MHCIGCEPLRLNETTWAVSWCGQVRRHVGSPLTGTVQLTGLGLRPNPCKGNIIRCPFHIELGEALFELTLARSPCGTYGYISYHGRGSMRIPTMVCSNVPMSVTGGWKASWVIPDVYTVLRGCRLYPGSHPGSFL